MLKKISICMILMIFFAGSTVFAHSGSLFNITTQNANLTITTTIPNHLYRAAGLKIRNSNTYQLLHPSECQAITNQGYCLFSVSDKQSKSITVSAVPGTIELELCLMADSSSPLSCQNYSMVITIYPSIYVASSGGDVGVYYCPLNTSDGSLGTCTLTPSGQSWSPFQIAFARVSGTQYAYVADNNSGIYQCSIDGDLTSNTYGALTACSHTGSGVSSPTGVSVATVGPAQYAYVSTNVQGLVYVCSMDATTGALGVCIDAYNFSTWPFATTFATVNGTQYAYVAGAANVYQCSLNTINGTFSSCNSIYTLPSSGTTNALGFATVNGTSYAYVLSYSPDAIYQCTLLSDGSFNICNPLSIPSMNPRGISFGVIDGTQYVYIADINGNVFLCDIESDGTFSGCTITPTTGAPNWAPRSVTVATIY